MSNIKRPKETIACNNYAILQVCYEVKFDVNRPGGNVFWAIRVSRVDGKEPVGRIHTIASYPVKADAMREARRLAKRWPLGELLMLGEANTFGRVQVKYYLNEEKSTEETIIQMEENYVISQVDQTNLRKLLHERDRGNISAMLFFKHGAYIGYY